MDIMWIFEKIQKYIWMTALIVYLQNLMQNMLCSYGGHDLFASMSELENLWQTELEVIDIIENISKRLDHPPKALKR